MVSCGAYYAAILVGHITGLARPSVCLSVCLCLIQAVNSKTKRQRKTRIGGYVVNKHMQYELLIVCSGTAYVIRELLYVS